MTHLWCAYYLLVIRPEFEAVMEFDFFYTYLVQGATLDQWKMLLCP